MTASSPDQLAPGSILADRYEIIRRLGAGGMGTVYLARHLLMDRLCALKVLPPGQHRDPEALKRFTREAQNASRIIHPHVCTVYDFGTTDDGVAYLAMEYLEGRTLGAILAGQPRLPLDRAIRLTRAIAGGLDAAHELGIVHRDLKPDNVMVIATKTGGEAVKLVDFGIAKALAQDPSGGVTAPGVVIGTPDYMAPEQFAGDPVDPRADTYALGVMFYRMVTGSLPHQGESARDTLTKRLTEPARPLAEAAPDTMQPEGLQTVVDRVLARRPADRYPTAGAFGTALVELFTGPLEIATMPTVRLDTATAPVPQPVPRRRGVALAVGGVLGVATIAALVVLRPSGGNVATPPGNTAVQPVPPPSTQLPPAMVPSPVQDTGRTASPRTRPGGGLRPVNPTPESLRIAPPPPSAVPSTPLPTINDLIALNVVDSSSRDADRAKAVQYYNQTEADAEVRARAAFMAAIAYNLDREYQLAESWVNRAIATNQDTAPGAERAERDLRYRNWRMTNRRMMTSDTTGS